MDQKHFLIPFGINIFIVGGSEAPLVLALIGWIRRILESFGGINLLIMVVVNHPDLNPNRVD